ncbi:MAG: hypothetical protein A2X94_04600 [Bdellovibrionales bacterium GWB1_55_8]|nr:MAG: hypothetical protein A2X94_04600 [Bdellovibrionales bacterium GWB1_55_8]
MKVRWRFRHAIFLLLGSAVLTYASISLQHERLRFRNTFQLPEEVVSYYCGRDASGFVWSGLLESERKAFTLWNYLPDQDSFFVAEKYEVLTGKRDPKNANEATVEVVYDILGVGDAHGNLVQTADKKRHVVFRLKKDKGSWKIAAPDEKTISPVVLASKFQFANFGK